MNKKCSEYVRLCQIAQENGDGQKALEYSGLVLQSAKQDTDISAGLLLRAMSLAMLGKLELSAADFVQLMHDDPSDVGGYYLGSVLASSGKFDAADRIFKRNLSIPIGPEKWATTGSIRFEKNFVLDPAELPLTRFFDDKEIELGSFERVYFVCCDSKYLKLFGRNLVDSVSAHAPPGTGIHIHIVNPTPIDLEFAENLDRDCDLQCVVSSESVDFPALDADQRKTYYACCRYFVLPRLLEAYQCPILVADMDQLVVNNLSPVYESIDDADIRLLRFPKAAFNLMSLFSASVSLFTANESSKQFATRLSEYILWRMSTGKCFEWHLDQAALAVLCLTTPDTKLSYFEPTIMHSSGDGSADYPKDTVFWSITFSIEKNRAKLANLDKGEARNKPPRISVVIPVYNGANYMQAAIDSALAQDWDDLEVIVVNDGSDDDNKTQQIALSYGDRIVYVEQANGGVASALNKGISIMTGDVFCWLSHDDLHYPNKTRAQVEYWESLGSPDVILYSDYTLIDADGKKITDVALDHELLIEKPLYGLLRGSIHGCSIFVPRGLFVKHGVFDTALPTTQDYDLWARMIKSCLFIHMPQALIASRWHDEQGSKHMEHELEAAELWAKLMEIPTAAERVMLEGSEYLYFAKLSTFLEINGLTAPAEVALHSAREGVSKTLVSVVIPVFNRFEMLVSAIESVLAQTHDCIEIIVVDDGSAQSTDILAELFEEHKGRLMFIRQDNAGPAAARNRACKVAKGKYIAFLDADDLFLPEKIQAQLNAMEHRALKMSHTSYWRYTRGSSVLHPVSSGENLGGGEFPNIIANCQIATPTVMVERNLWLDRFGFPENQRLGEDVMVWLNMASQNLVVGLEDILTIVRVGTETAALNNDTQQLGLQNILSAIDSNVFLANQNYEVNVLADALMDLDRRRAN